VALPQLSFGHATVASAEGLVLRTCVSPNNYKNPLQYTMAAAPDYTVVYGVGLLDDVHNYFPALLYDSGRFQNTTQIFHYVRHQLNERFNLFSYGASLHAARNPPGPVTTTTNPPPPSQPLSAASTLQTMNALLGFLTLPEDIELDFRMPRSPRTRRIAQTWAFNDPVVVRPSAQVIASATETVAGSTLAENTGCAICQDTISNTESARRLRACGHVYHTGCIDEWFHRSVFCPACRHDIRQPLAPAPVPAPATTEVEPPAEETHSYFQ
jgi:hypothetical protein